MRSFASRSSAAQVSSSICTRLPGISGLAWTRLLLLRHSFAFLARLRKRDGDCLLAALHFARFAARSASRRAALEATHLSFDVLRHPGGIFTFPFLRHLILL